QQNGKQQPGDRDLDPVAEDPGEADGQRDEHHEYAREDPAEDDDRPRHADIDHRPLLNQRPHGIPGRLTETTEEDDVEHQHSYVMGDRAPEAQAPGEDQVEDHGVDDRH